MCRAVYRCFGPGNNVEIEVGGSVIFCWATRTQRGEAKHRGLGNTRGAPGSKGEEQKEGKQDFQKRHKKFATIREK